MQARIDSKLFPYRIKQKKGCFGIRNSKNPFWVRKDRKILRYSRGALGSLIKITARILSLYLIFQVLFSMPLPDKVTQVPARNSDFFQWLAPHLVNCHSY